MIKRVILLKRKNGISRDEFKIHWINVHAEMLKRFSQIKKYVINYVADSNPDPLYDGIAEIWFDNEDSMKELDTSQLFRAFLASDNPKFQNLESRWSTIVEERDVIA